MKLYSEIDDKTTQQCKLQPATLKWFKGEPLLLNLSTSLSHVLAQALVLPAAAA